MTTTPSILEILKYFGLDTSLARTLNQSQLIYLIKKYYSEVKSSK